MKKAKIVTRDGSVKKAKIVTRDGAVKNDKMVTRDGAVKKKNKMAVRGGAVTKKGTTVRGGAVTKKGTRVTLYPTLEWAMEACLKCKKAKGITFESPIRMRTHYSHCAQRTTCAYLESSSHSGRDLLVERHIQRTAHHPGEASVERRQRDLLLDLVVLVFSTLEQAGVRPWCIAPREEDLECGDERQGTEQRNDRGSGGGGEQGSP